jgi:hypothetical protein
VAGILDRGGWPHDDLVLVEGEVGVGRLGRAEESRLDLGVGQELVSVMDLGMGQRLATVRGDQAEQRAPFERLQDRPGPSPATAGAATSQTPGMAAGVVTRRDATARAAGTQTGPKIPNDARYRWFSM